MTARRQGSEGRVEASHRIAAAAFRLAGVFAVVAAVWAVVAATRGGSWWGPLHSFLLGTVLFAIAGASQMFTLTWAAAPPPKASLPAAQRRVLLAGVVLVLWGVGTGTRWVGGLGAAAVTGGLGLLAWSLVSSIRRSLLRRFDLATRYYLLAIGCGVVGVGLGALMALGLAGGSFLDVRTSHARLNLVGLVGMTIVGTIPTLMPTFVPTKAVSGTEVRLALWVGLAGMVAIAAGAAAGGAVTGAGVLLAAAAAAVVLVGIVGRIGRKAMKAGLTYLHVGLGVAWLVAWAAVDGVRLIGGSDTTPWSGWVAAAAVAGVGQVLLGSLAYLIPVLAGRPPRLGRNLARMKARPWLPLLLANLAGILLVAENGLATFAVAAWVVDFAARLAILEWRD
ncbi:MAG: hypothetical protein DIU67_000105 [Actinomycetes bacterium]